MLRNCHRWQKGEEVVFSSFNEVSYSTFLQKADQIMYNMLLLNNVLLSCIQIKFWFFSPLSTVSCFGNKLQSCIPIGLADCSTFTSATYKTHFLHWHLTAAEHSTRSGRAKTARAKEQLKQINQETQQQSTTDTKKGMFFTIGFLL